MFISSELLRDYTALWPPVGEGRQARHLPPLPIKCSEKNKIDENEL
jgi:hypothetical protein